jgi:protein ImuB
MVDAGRGYPMEISAWGKDRSVYGKVVGLAGPWRASGEWWRSDLWARDEWDVAVEARGQRTEGSGQKSDFKAAGGSTRVGPGPIIYRLYRELKNGAWFIEGIYD